MYKNFNITESEKEQILDRLKENGYKQPINKKVMSEERHISLDILKSQYNIKFRDGNNIVVQNKAANLTDNDRNEGYGVFNIKKGYWVDGYEPIFVEGDVSLYGNESKEYFILEKFNSKNGNSFYFLSNTTFDNESDGGYMNGKIFGQSDFDEVMGGLTPVDDSNEGDNEEKYQGGPDPVYTDSVYEEDETMDKEDYMAKYGENSLNEGKQILINTFKRYL